MVCGIRYSQTRIYIEFATDTLLKLNIHNGLRRTQPKKPRIFQKNPGKTRILGLSRKVLYSLGLKTHVSATLIFIILCGTKLRKHVSILSLRTPTFSNLIFSMVCDVLKIQKTPKIQQRPFQRVFTPIFRKLNIHDTLRKPHPFKKHFFI